jgi:hypothetical protein
MVVGFLTMKWFDRTARGFSPGKRPMANRPARATDGCVVSAKLIVIGTNADVANKSIRLPFQGNSAYPRQPGPKPWAVFFNHFMVSADAGQTIAPCNYE